MDKFVIQGGIPLQGEVTPSGNKNAALPFLAACLLTDEPIVMHNVPEIRDVIAMRGLLESLGVNFTSLGNHTWRIQSSDIRSANLDPEKCRQIRASILLAGPMLARTGELILPPPGGDVIGRRRVDTHTLALQALGAEADYVRSDHVFQFRAASLKGANILLDEASVTATENAIMAAVYCVWRDHLTQCGFRTTYSRIMRFSKLIGRKYQSYWFEYAVYPGCTAVARRRIHHWT